MEAGKERLARNTVRDATRQEIEQLKRENGDLKEIVADLLLETHRLKKPLSHRYPTAEAAYECHQEGRDHAEGRHVQGSHAQGAKGAWCSEKYLLPMA